jgi:hypothetical protein
MSSQGFHLSLFTHFHIMMPLCLHIYLYKIIGVHVLDSIIRDWLEPPLPLKAPNREWKYVGPATQSQAARLINSVFANL